MVQASPPAQPHCGVVSLHGSGHDVPEEDDVVVLDDEDVVLVEPVLDVDVEVEVDVEPDPELVDPAPPSAPLPPMPVNVEPLAHDAPASTISRAPERERWRRWRTRMKAPRC
jgi:hypothetical protein